VISPFTESLNPIKMFEYLATGLPVVSTPVAGIRDIPELVYLANGEKEFAAKVEIALAESDEELRSRRRAFAEKNSWDRRVAMVADLLASMSGRDSQFMQALETHVAAEG
ncbi:MAG: hypothetical protein JWO59_2173, partial [Chloroflexi bacterium]|nr:hypothetical protein [Chloroflexota bacterium]